MIKIASAVFNAKIFRAKFLYLEFLCLPSFFQLRMEKGFLGNGIYVYKFESLALKHRYHAHDNTVARLLYSPGEGAGRDEEDG